ncbi:MAG: hypothetical protein JXC36_09400 [Candidatus Atribacteria bacterium]|nr:hypothetical protein [Candidatus Atribacteria bacterium]
MNCDYTILIKPLRANSEFQVRNEFERFQKNVPTYLRSNVHNRIAVGTESKIHEASGKILILNGEIYGEDAPISGNQAEILFKLYNKKGINFVSDLNGSFSIIIIESCNIYFITDRLNTYKIFIREESGSYWLSSNIDNIPKLEELSHAGVASYLINGHLLCNLTLYKDVFTLDRSTIYTINGCGINQRKYWDYLFEYENQSRSDDDLANELCHILIRSVKRRINGDEKIYISLSGGWDARGILGIVKHPEIDHKNVELITYTHGPLLPDSDAEIAAKLAKSAGFNHRTFEFYNNNIKSVIADNASMGKGLSYFCQEVNFWKMMGEEFKSSEKNVFMHGNMANGTFSSFHGDHLRAISRSEVYDNSILKPYQNLFEDEFYQNMITKYDQVYEKVKQKILRYENIVDALDYLDLDQKVPFVYNSWRENYQRPFVKVLSPYLDNDFLDFMRKLKPEQRNKKHILKLALAKIAPELFSISRNTISEPYPDWDQEIRAEKDYFINKLQNDNYLAPFVRINEFSEFLNPVTQALTFKTRMRSVLKIVHRSFSKIFPNYYEIIEAIPMGKKLTRKAGNYIKPKMVFFLPKLAILLSVLQKEDK